ncbi:hypothetical protein CEXT_211671 [Caerostris extrusa]|uniref:Uncharacterized protein n=1 Tax=Caerostris extrusa TaxID=172846 RepID=A0AAV4Q1Y3_CAEEX|nr:hypothetical protein CEXT_211671 [Caerostris extrusa]
MVKLQYGLARPSFVFGLVGEEGGGEGRRATGLSVSKREMKLDLSQRYSPPSKCSKLSADKSDSRSSMMSPSFRWVSVVNPGAITVQYEHPHMRSLTIHIFSLGQTERFQSYEFNCSSSAAGAEIVVFPNREGLVRNPTGKDLPKFFSYYKPVERKVRPLDAGNREGVILTH